MSNEQIEAIRKEVEASEKAVETDNGWVASETIIAHRGTRYLLDHIDKLEALHVAAKACEHENVVPSYTHVTCDKCGMVKTDSSRSWGSASGKWFDNLSEAKRNK